MAAATAGRKRAIRSIKGSADGSIVEVEPAHGDEREEVTGGVARRTRSRAEANPGVTPVRKREAAARGAAAAESEEAGAGIRDEPLPKARAPRAKAPAKAPPKLRAEARAAGRAAGAGDAAAAEGGGDTRQPRYYLMKTEPSVFSISDLAGRPLKTEPWEGVRNYAARNCMQRMRVGDEAFFYHSNCAEPGIVGTVRIAREAYPDHFAFDPESKYYDPKSSPDAPRWHMVDVQLEEAWDVPVTLRALKEHREGPLAGMVLLRQGRLSVQEVTEGEWSFILGLRKQC